MVMIGHVKFLNFKIGWSSQVVVAKYKDRLRQSIMCSLSGWVRRTELRFPSCVSALLDATKNLKVGSGYCQNLVLNLTYNSNG